MSHSVLHRELEWHASRCRKQGMSFSNPAIDRDVPSVNSIRMRTPSPAELK